jgi:hypothetical protein
MVVEAGSFRGRTKSQFAEIDEGERKPREVAEKSWRMTRPPEKASLNAIS